MAYKGGDSGDTYFDDTYFHNGQPVDHTGYCTDIWFDEAMRFIEDESGPALLLLHYDQCAPRTLPGGRSLYGPIREMSDRYPEPAFYGMIANIDENFGKLVEHLDMLGLTEDTILIFMTDNGSSGGWREAVAEQLAVPRDIPGTRSHGRRRLPCSGNRRP